MSRLGIRIASAFALVVAAAILFLTHRSAGIIEASQEDTLRGAASLHLRAIRQVLSEEAGGIAKRLEPLARVRELRFRVEPAHATPSVTPDTSAVDTTSTSPAEATAPLDPVGLQRFIEEVLPVTGLDVLEVTDAEGVVLARGQYPESFGEKRTDSALAAVRAGAIFKGVRVEPFPDSGRIALVAAVPIRAGEDSSAAVVGMLSGGIRLDRLVGRLAELTGAVVEIATVEKSITSTGRPVLARASGIVEENGALYFAASEEIEPDRNLQGRVRILVPAGEGVKARQALLAENVRIGALAILFAACAGIALALGPTRRLTRLTRAAVAIGGGDLETPIAVKGGDEIGILGETLTRTARALKEERERLATSERVAAWRDAARKLAHELKNAITPIGLALRTVKRASEKDGDANRAAAAEALAATEDEMKHLQSLVDQFSQFARLPAPAMAPYDLPRALKNAATIYATSGATVRMNIPDQLAPLAADEELMGRVWSNLISNAVAAAGPQGWVEISATIGSSERIEIAIMDSGPGLPEERLKGGIGEGMSTKPGGWGVGLALSERIVSEHGGAMRMENAPHGGARMVVSLPLRPAGGSA